MTIALAVMTDGRVDCVTRTIPAFFDNVDRPDLVTDMVLHDDSGDPDYAAFLESTFGPLGFRVVSTGTRQGFAGAIRSMWSHLRQRSSARFVFHLEDDFVARRTIPLADMRAVLLARPKLVQVALRRQPWNEQERQAGGVVEQHPDAYVEYSDASGRAWLEHRLFFTTNPSLYRMALVLDEDWPTGAESEGRFTHRLLVDPEVRFGFYGARDSGEWVEHVGDTRNGCGY